MAVQIPLELVLATQGTLPPAGVTLRKMDPRALLPQRKWTLYVGDKKKRFRSWHGEQVSHILMKAFMWALYMPQYDEIQVELKLGTEFKPDLVQLDRSREPVFWGEAGYVRLSKLQTVLARYPATHFVLGKWAGCLHSYIDVALQAWPDDPRRSPIDVVIFPEDSAERFITDKGHIQISHDDVEWIQIYDTPLSS